MHGFQNKIAQLLSSRRKSDVQNICLYRLKVKVTLEGQMINGLKLSLSGTEVVHLRIVLPQTANRLKGQIGLGLFHLSPHLPFPPPWAEGQGHTGRSNDKMVINLACPGHNLYINALLCPQLRRS